MPPEGQPIITEAIQSEGLQRGDVVRVSQKAIIQLGPRAEDWVPRVSFKAAVVRIAGDSRDKSMFKNIGEDVSLQFDGNTATLFKDWLFSTKTRWVKKEE